MRIISQKGKYTTGFPLWGLDVNRNTYNVSSSYYIHKEGLIALDFSMKRDYWNGTKQVIATFCYKKVTYVTAFDYLKTDRSLAISLGKFVKECVSVNKKTL